MYPEEAIMQITRDLRGTPPAPDLPYTPRSDAPPVASPRPAGRLRRLIRAYWAGWVRHVHGG